MHSIRRADQDTLGSKEQREHNIYHRTATTVKFTLSCTISRRDMSHAYISIIPTYKMYTNLDNSFRLRVPVLQATKPTDQTTISVVHTE